MRWSFPTLLLLTVAFVARAQSDVRFCEVAAFWVRAEPSAGSARVRRVEAGSSLERLSSKGAWTRVRVGSDEGWIPSLLVGPKPPLVGVAPISGHPGTTSAFAPHRPSDPADYHPDYAALDRLEALQPGESQVRDFLTVGGLERP